MDKLKPCPFCGSSRIRRGWTIGNNDYLKWFAWCMECEAQGPVVFQRGNLEYSSEYPEKAIAAWDRRKNNE